MLLHQGFLFTTKRCRNCFLTGGGNIPSAAAALNTFVRNYAYQHHQLSSNQQQQQTNRANKTNPIVTSMYGTTRTTTTAATSGLLRQQQEHRVWNNNKNSSTCNYNPFLFLFVPDVHTSCTRSTTGSRYNARNLSTKATTGTIETPPLLVVIHPFMLPRRTIRTETEWHQRHFHSRNTYYHTTTTPCFFSSPSSNVDGEKNPSKNSTASSTANTNKNNDNGEETNINNNDNNQLNSTDKIEEGDEDDVDEEGKEIVLYVRAGTSVSSGVREAFSPLQQRWLFVMRSGIIFSICNTIYWLWYYFDFIPTMNESPYEYLHIQPQWGVIGLFVATVLNIVFILFPYRTVTKVIWKPNQNIIDLYTYQVFPFFIRPSNRPSVSFPTGSVYTMRFNNNSNDNNNNNKSSKNKTTTATATNDKNNNSKKPRPLLDPVSEIATHIIKDLEGDLTQYKGNLLIGYRWPYYILNIESITNILKPKLLFEALFRTEYMISKKKANELRILALSTNKKKRRGR